MIHLIRLLICCLTCAIASSGATAAEEEQKSWARSPKEIAFQNDSQWEDNRWQATDVGPLVSASIDTGRRPTLKGIAIRVGEQQQAAVCFDTAMLQLSAAWTGDFLRFGPRRFGLIARPAVAGDLFFTTPRSAGWANDRRFEPTPVECNWPGEEKGISRLPKNWAHYHGLYLHGPRVVLAYSVAGSRILESPWYVQSGSGEAFTRSLEISPSRQTMQLRVAGTNCTVTKIGNPPVQVRQNKNQVPLLIVPPHEQTIRVKLLITRKSLDADSLELLRTAAGDAENLSQWIRDDTPRWPETLVTTGTTTESGGPYVIDTLTLPFENPYKALLFTAGHDFFSNGDAAVCTVHGDVWVVSGIDRSLRNIRWRRFATGLFQPLGLKIVDDKIYVLGRDQITRLNDRNRDGEADYYENFNNDVWVTGGAHDFVTCLDTDPDGNFYFIHARTGVMRVSRDGSSLEQIADGFRNPNGMAVGPDGTITASPQQGGWTPESSIAVVEPGKYYGFGGPRITKERPTGWDLPMCFVPRAMDNSSGAQVWVQSDRWGPLNGQMLHLSYGQCRLLLVLTEKVDGVYQGGSIRFPTDPADFESGIMRGRFNPRDGQLYVTGLRGWQTRAVRDGCFQRVRYTGGPVHLPIGVKTFQNGIQLTFDEPLDPSAAENPENYFVQQWNYLWSEQYGSPDFSVTNPKQQGRDEVEVVSATLMEDGHSIFLEMPGRQPVMQISISWLLMSAAGSSFRGEYVHTINASPTEVVPDSRITRRTPPRRIPIQVEQRLKPGLQFRFRTDDPPQEDTRIARLVALSQSTDKSPTPFLPAGAFSLTVEGTLQVPLSGFYHFRVNSDGSAQVRINDVKILGESADGGRNAIETADAILLHKGHNRLQIDYASPKRGSALLRLWWKGADFDWEPVPPRVFFHDSGAKSARVASTRRLGRQLFARHGCGRCHQTGQQRVDMFELSLMPPDLSAAGSRLSAPWLRRWILDPAKVRPDSHMPAILGNAGSPDARRRAADITAFLLDQTVTSGTFPEVLRGTGRELDGERLYEDLGCIACHHFEAPAAADDYDRISLRCADSKYQRGALVRFLLAPTKHYPASAMPDFYLSEAEAAALARLIRSRAENEGAASLFGENDAGPVFPRGDATRGRQLFARTGCQNCHRIADQHPAKTAHLPLNVTETLSGCLAAGGSYADNVVESSVVETNVVESNVERAEIPSYSFSADERRALHEFVRQDLDSLARSHPAETSRRLVQQLRCTSCHDRDAMRAHRSLVTIEEGSGRIPKPLPPLTWTGEKLWPTWTEARLSGAIEYQSRPWLDARMPAFPAYAERLARGLAAEHAVDPDEVPTFSVDRRLAEIGQQLTRQTALDCRQCHGIGSQQPRGDEQTQIHQGINFSYLRDRLRDDYYMRFVLNPSRYDRGSNMPRLSENGLSTKIKQYFDADARQQFDAIWHYIQSLPAE